MRHGDRRLVAIDGDAHELGAGARQRRHLARRRLDVGGVGVGHRLHRDRRAAADHDRAGAAPDAHADAGAARRRPEGRLVRLHRHGVILDRAPRRAPRRYLGRPTKIVIRSRSEGRCRGAARRLDHQGNELKLTPKANCATQAHFDGDEARDHLTYALPRPLNCTSRESPDREAQLPGLIPRRPARVC